MTLPGNFGRLGVGGLGLGLTSRLGAAGAASIITTGLVAEWRFDDGSGQVLTDYSGNGHHGQLGSTSGADANDPAWGTSPARLTTDGDDIVILPAATAIFGGLNWTFQFVAKGDNETTPASFNIVGVTSSSTLERGILGGKSFGDVAALSLDIRNGTAIAFRSGAVWDGSAHFVSVARNGDTFIVWVDSTKDTNVQDTSEFSTLDEAAFFAQEAGSSHAPNGFELHHAVLYNRTLTDEEVATNRGIIGP